MSFSAAVLVSSAVEVAGREWIERRALANWPFLRTPVRMSHPDRVILAPPETSERLHPTRESLERAFGHNSEFYDALAAWSRAIARVRFALIEAECFDEVCRYGGFICSGGRVIREVVADRRGHVHLLQEVGIACDDFFAPFVRGYFRDGRPLSSAHAGVSG